MPHSSPLESRLVGEGLPASPAVLEPTRQGVRSKRWVLLPAARGQSCPLVPRRPQTLLARLCHCYLLACHGEGPPRASTARKKSGWRILATVQV